MLVKPHVNHSVPSCAAPSLLLDLLSLLEDFEVDVIVESTIVLKIEPPGATRVLVSATVLPPSAEPSEASPETDAVVTPVTSPVPVRKVAALVV